MLRLRLSMARQRVAGIVPATCISVAVLAFRFPHSDKSASSPGHHRVSSDHHELRGDLLGATLVTPLLRRDGCRNETEIESAGRSQFGRVQPATLFFHDLIRRRHVAGSYDERFASRAFVFPGFDRGAVGVAQFDPMTKVAGWILQELPGGDKLVGLGGRRSDEERNGADRKPS